MRKRVKRHAHNERLKSGLHVRRLFLPAGAPIADGPRVVLDLSARGRGIFSLDVHHAAFKSVRVRPTCVDALFPRLAAAASVRPDRRISPLATGQWHANRRSLRRNRFPAEQRRRNRFPAGQRPPSTGRHRMRHASSETVHLPSAVPIYYRFLFGGAGHRPSI